MMEIDIKQLTTALVVSLSPFLPFLTEIGLAGGRKLSEIIGEHGGEAAWKKIQEIWVSLKNRIGDDPEAMGIVTILAAKPDDKNRQKILADVLFNRLVDDPELAKELFELIGKQGAMQEILVKNNSWVEDILQSMSGIGNQTIKAIDGSVVKGVKQIKE
jgi:hypothetical protein